MARRKRQYGSGCLLSKGKGWAIRWREIEIAPDGSMHFLTVTDGVMSDGPLAERDPLLLAVLVGTLPD